jgi:acyl-CoA thioesterase-1
MMGKHGVLKRFVQPAIGHGLKWWLLLLLAVAGTAAAQDKDPPPPQRTILVLGDSLSAAYGMKVDEGWVALLDKDLAPLGWRVRNASMAGQTTAGGASRIVADLRKHKPKMVIIQLGPNDGLRGLDLKQTRVNLARIIGAAHGAGAKVLLVGMRLPPNFSQKYTREFEAVFEELAGRFDDVTLLPFLLEPFAEDRDSFQADNLHPTAAAQPQIKDHVNGTLGPLLRQLD